MKPHVRILEVKNNYVMFEWMGQRILLKSAIATEIPRVVESLASPQSIQSLFDKLQKPWTPELLARLMAAFLANKLIGVVDAPGVGEAIVPATTFSNRWLSYLQMLTRSEADARAALTNFEKIKVAVFTRFCTPDDFLKAFPRLERKPLVPNFENPDGVNILLAAASDLETLWTFGTAAAKDRRAVLPVLVDRFGAIVGPLTGGVGQPCLICLSRRLQAGLAQADQCFDLPQSHFDATVAAWPAVFWENLGAIVEAEVVRWKTGLSYSPLQTGAYRFDFLNHRSDFEDVYPVPGCSCSADYRYDWPDESSSH